MLLAVVCNELVLKHVFREQNAVDKQMYHSDGQKQLEKDLGATLGIGLKVKMNKSEF